MIHFIVWIIVSGIAGFIASKIVNKSGSGMLMDILLGIVGGLVGGFIVQRIPAVDGLLGTTGVMGFVTEVVVAMLGAVLVLWLYHLIFRRRAA